MWNSPTGKIPPNDFHKSDQLLYTSIVKSCGYLKVKLGTQSPKRSTHPMVTVAAWRLFGSYAHARIGSYQVLRHVLPFCHACDEQALKHVPAGVEFATGKVIVCPVQTLPEPRNEGLHTAYR